MTKATCKRCKGIGLLYRDPRGRDYLGDYVAVECDNCEGTGNKYKLLPYGCKKGPNGKHSWEEGKEFVYCEHCEFEALGIKKRRK